MTERRSTLLHPADRLDTLAQALSWGPNALCLDLDSLVHPSQRQQARKGVQEALQGALSGVEVLVRIGGEREADLRGALAPGLGGVVCPLEGPQQVLELDGMLGELEGQRDIPRGSLQILAFLDTGRGLRHAREIASASPRVDALVLGMGDLAIDMLKVPEEVPYFTGPVPHFPVPEYLWSRMATVAAATGVQLLGLLGTTIARGHASRDTFTEAVRLARLAGFKGAFTLHQEGIEACNRGFSR